MSKADWRWLGSPGHFICSHWCRFHLATIIGPWLVSTVGEYVHPRHGKGSEKAESEWLEKNWPGEEIGPKRKYETMVFSVLKVCDRPNCDCGMPMIEGHEIDSAGYNSRKDAQAGHEAMCEKWDRKVFQ